MKNDAELIFDLIATYHGLSKSCLVILKNLMMLVDDKGLININANQKKSFSSENKLAFQTVNNCIQTLKSSGLLVAVDTGTFKPNKSIFVDDYFNGLYARTKWIDLDYDLKLNSKIGLIQIVGAA